ncbi:unnamed protein product [Caretta caretta]
MVQYYYWIEGYQEGNKDGTTGSGPRLEQERKRTTTRNTTDWTMRIRNNDTKSGTLKEYDLLTTRMAVSKFLPSTSGLEDVRSAPLAGPWRAPAHARRSAQWEQGSEGAQRGGRKAAAGIPHVAVLAVRSQATWRASCVQQLSAAQILSSTM